MLHAEHLQVTHVLLETHEQQGFVARLKIRQKSSDCEQNWDGMAPESTALSYIMHLCAPVIASMSRILPLRCISCFRNRRGTLGECVLNLIPRKMQPGALSYNRA